jgi:hypothetical protein
MRAVCAYCRRDVRVRTSGALFRHAWLVGAVDPPPRCPGSGLPPKASKNDEAAGR